VKTWEYLSNRTENYSEKVILHGRITEKLYKNERNQSYRLKIDNIDNISTKNDNNKEDIHGISIIVEVPRNIHITK
jgi:hypothetical protein